MTLNGEGQTVAVRAVVRSNVSAGYVCASAWGVVHSQTKTYNQHERPDRLKVTVPLATTQLGEWTV